MMKYDGSMHDNFSIAWFKLAECVNRGEKERAFAMHRLLAHSINDPALVFQLEGDIALACKDTARAVEAYKKAALKYSELNQLDQTAAVYEHLFYLLPNDFFICENLVTLFQRKKNSSKLIEYFPHFLNFLSLKSDEATLISTTENYADTLEKEIIVTFYEDILYASWLDHGFEGLKKYLVEQIMLHYLAENDDTGLEQWKDRLAVLRPDLIRYTQ
ncbi:hypothetical protein IPH25_00270 [bacterium]|nr:MAG: hypothetical protein IPG37_02385 [bacterium]QQR61868.1 MAG: hypothetical protein IPH25_00270 [bacterium]QQR62551.1 MAG: hypothetical protein IPH67_03970 [bacterium]